MTAQEIVTMVHKARERLLRAQQAEALCDELTSLEALASNLTQAAYDKAVTAVQTKALIGGLLR